MTIRGGGGVTLMVSLTAKYPFFLESPNTQYTSGKSGCKLLTLFDNDSDDGVSAVMVLQFWTAVVVPELSVACLRLKWIAFMHRFEPLDVCHGSLMACIPQKVGFSLDLATLRL